MARTWEPWPIFSGKESGEVTSAVVKTLFSFFVPCGLLFLAAAVVLQMGVLARSLPAVVHIYPYAVAGAGILLGWRFNRSRLVFAVVVLALADRSLLHFGPGSAASAGMGRALYNVVGLLLPLNLALLSLVKERGIVTLRGIWRLGSILLQVLAVMLACKYWQLGMAAFLDYSFIKARFLTRIPVAQPTLLVFGAAFLLVSVRFIKRRDVIDSGFFWALVSVLFALAVGRVGPLSTVYFATAGLVLVISVLETSYSMAFKDELTGLPARRALNEALLKLGSSYTAAMLDIDFFKKFNDRYGHDVGDQVLRMIAAKIAKVTGGGKAFRYGGEEFTIIFPGKFADEAIPHLERLRKAVGGSSFVIRGPMRPRKKPEDPKKIKGSRQKVSITVSIGAAERNESHTSPQQVVDAADKALYRAKKAGRNRVKI
jgi:diguanylate cyclase (GGDEF)-like protein